MSFFVVQAMTEGSKRCPQIGQMIECDTYEIAIDKAVALAVEETEDLTEAEIREEIETDGDFADNNGMFTISVCQPEN